MKVCPELATDHPTQGKTGEKRKLKETHDTGAQARTVRRGLREVREQRRRNSRDSHAFQGPAEVEDSRMWRQGEDANGRGPGQCATHHEPSRRDCIGCQTEGDGCDKLRSV